MCPNIGEWQFDDLPEQLAPELYDQATQEFVHYFSAVEGVCSIYRYGSVTYPGLSDLDFMVLLDDGYRHRAGTQYRSPSLSLQSKRVIYHQQFFMPRKLFPVYPLMLPIFEIQHVWGKRCKHQQYPEEVLRIANTLFLCEDIATIFPEFVLSCLLRKSVRVRHAQAQLNLITKFSRLAERVTGRSLPGADRFEQQVTSLRKHWFSKAVEENCLTLTRAIEDALVLVSGMADIISDYVTQSNLFPPLSQDYPEWSIPYSFLRVSFNRGSAGITYESPKGFRRAKVLAPLGLMLPLVCLSSGTGPLSSYIRNLFEQNPPKYDFSENSTLQRIVNAKNMHCSFLKEGGIPIHIFGYFSYHSDYSPGVRTFARLALRRLSSR